MRENKPALIDPFSRRIEYARFSVTDRCNLRCTYRLPKVIRFMSMTGG
jgi:cyclic pyranopterin phosphate synthase